MSTQKGERVKAIRRPIVICLVVLGLLAASTQAWAASWIVQTTPNPGSENSLLAVTTTSASNAWAVGWYRTTGKQRTLIEHLSGSTWSKVTSPNVSGHDNRLYGVRATSSSNIWAVGVNAGPTADRGLIEHYDGSSWTIQPSAGGNNVDLFGVGALSTSNAWAVGDGPSGAFAEHYDGTSWTSVPVPGTALGILFGVTLTSTGAWAVGTTVSSLQTTLIAQYDGTAWSVVSSPDPSGTRNVLLGVSANSASDVWGVGYFANGTGELRTLVVHYDGSTWKRVISPDRGTRDNVFNAVKAVSATDVWAVGYDLNSSGLQRTLIEHYDGSTWTVQTSPNPSSLNDELFGVGSTSSSNTFAVGYQGNGSAPMTLAMHCAC